MKTFKEFIAESDKNIEYPFKNKNVKVVDDDYINLQPTTKSPGGKFAGTTSWGSQRVWADLWMLKPSELSGISLKPNEYVFRYTSNVTQIA